MLQASFQTLLFDRSAFARRKIKWSGLLQLFNCCQLYRKKKSWGGHAFRIPLRTPSYLIYANFVAPKKFKTKCQEQQYKILPSFSILKPGTSQISASVYLHSCIHLLKFPLTKLWQLFELQAHTCSSAK